MADAELDLLTHWGDPGEGSRKRTAGVVSVLVHATVVILLAVVPAGLVESPRVLEAVHITPLIEPLTELTQKAPNKGRISKEFEAREVAPRPRLQVPGGAPFAPRPRPLNVPAPPAPKPAPPVALPEPPKLEAAAKEAPRPALPVSQAPAPPPQIQEAEKPKLALENVGRSAAPLSPDQRRVPIPDDSVRGAIRATPGGLPTGGQAVGDAGALGAGGYGEALNVPSTSGSQGGLVQLLSDPKGVDFKPYLTQILATVKRNWFAVMPEAVRLGRRGNVVIVFSINRIGGVPKLVISTSSGADALDRAAVAGISMSNPFPPLPTGYQGDKIVVQFNFAYNMPRR